MSTKRREGCDDELQNSHFTTVLDVRRARSDERVVSRLDRPNPPCGKKERNFKEVLIHNHSQQIFSADLLSRFFQQIFSADFLSRSSQQIFSADVLSRFSQQMFSADFLSRFSQQIFSADFLSRSSQQIFSADLLSRTSQQIFSLSCHLLWSGVGGQLLSYHSYHLLWSGVAGQLLSYHLLWSGVGGQLLSYHVGGLCWWSILHEFFRRTLPRSFREKVTIQKVTILALEISFVIFRRNATIQQIFCELEYLVPQFAEYVSDC